MPVASAALGTMVETLNDPSRADFDRSSRYILTSRAIRAMTEPPGPILDVGGSGGFLGALLTNFRTITLDVEGPDVDVAGTGAQLPFSDGTFAVAVALDVLEHVPSSLRPAIVQELTRVSYAGIIVVGPFDDPEIVRSERRLRHVYRALAGTDHRWLKEHEDFGLPQFEDLAAQLEELGLAVAKTTTNPLDLWERLQFANFLSSRCVTREPLVRVHEQMVTHYLDGHDEDAPGYRTILVASNDPAVAGTALQQVRPRDRRASWTTQTASAELDAGLAEAVGTTVQELERLRRQASQQGTRIEEQGRTIQELNDRSQAAERRNRELRSELESQHERVSALESEVAELGSSLEASRHALDGLRAERDAAERRAAQREAAEARGQRLKRELTEAHEDHRQLQEWLDHVALEHRKLLRSRRWNIGNAIGNIVEKLTPGQTPEKATARIEEALEEYEAWKDQHHDELRRRRQAREEDRAEGQPGSRTSSEGETEDPSLTHVWGTSAEEDRVYEQELYEQFVAQFEPSVEPTTSRASLRVVLLTQAPGDANVLPVALRRTVASTEALDASLTVIGDLPSEPFEAYSRDPQRLPASPELAKTLDDAVHGWEEDLIIFLHPGDVLSTDVGAVLNHEHSGGDAAAIVFDDDVMGLDGVRKKPRMKPGFSPEYLLEHDYVGNGVAFDTEALRTAGFGTLGEQLPRDLLMRLFERGDRIEKTDHVLLHRWPTEGRTDHAADERFALNTLDRRGLHGHGDVVRTPWNVHVRFRDPSERLVSIIVPFRDRPDLLETCVRSIVHLTTYPSYELLLVDNGSEEDETAYLLDQLQELDPVRVLRDPAPFNYSRINNRAVEHAHGEHLVFLNNDVKVLTQDWLEELTGYASLPDIGLVGGKLYYRNGRIQHAGIVVGLTGLAGHAFAGTHEHFSDAPDLAHVRNWSAVTGACAAIEREKFEQVGGFDERFQVTGSDVELGLRLLESAYRNVVNPAVRLFHYEKSSRSSIPVRAVDLQLSFEHYGPYLDRGDPYWNRNLSTASTSMLPRTEPIPTREEIVREALRRRGSGPPVDRDPSERGFLETYDADESLLAANREVLEAFTQQRDLECASLTWFLPSFDHVYRGGVYTVLRIATYMTQTYGTRNRLVLWGSRRIEPDVLREQIVNAFPDIDVEIEHLGSLDAVGRLEPTDAGICTLWTTAYLLLRYNQCRGKFYLVQDFEPSFYAASSMYGLVEQTYRFGFPGIANTPGVGNAYESYGNETLAFVPGVDREVFHPGEPEPPEDRFRIVFYGRPGNPRNAFELGVQALSMIKERYGDEVEILSVGAAFDEVASGIGDVLLNLGVLPDLRSVADLYRSSHAGLVFMFSKHPSYQPLEYMASGTATVTNYNESNDWLFNDGQNALLVPSTASGAADALSRLIEDPTLREKLVEGGLGTVKELEWEPQLDAIGRFMRGGGPRG